MAKPFTSELLRPDPLKIWRRSATAIALAEVTGRHLNEVVAKAWGDQPGQSELILRAATSPASTTGWGAQLTATAVGAFLDGLAPTSAAAQLFAASPRFNMAGLAAIAFPRATAGFPEPTFIAEGAPIPVRQASIDSVTMAPRKLAMLGGLSEELAGSSTENAETIITTLMSDATSRALDAAVFSNVAGSGVRPAGILNGVTPIAAATGGGTSAMVADIQSLVGAVADAGGVDILLFADPRQVVALSAYASNGVGYRVVSAPVLAAGTVVAVSVDGFASGFSDLPKVETSRDAVVHWDTSPTAIGMAGSPATVAAPAYSGFQSALISLRLILRCAWVNRRVGGVQYVTGTTW